MAALNQRKLGDSQPSDNSRPWWMPAEDAQNRPLWRSGQFPSREDEALTREEAEAPS